MSWKSQGGNKTNVKVATLNSNGGAWSLKDGYFYHKNKLAGSSVGIGTSQPFSRLSFGNHEELRIEQSDSFKEPILALSETKEGSSPETKIVNIIVEEKSYDNLQEIELSLIIFQVGQKVPLSLNAKVDSVEKLSLLINENKVEKIVIKEKSNNFFNDKNIKTFKNIKINFDNKKKLKGKNRFSVKSFADANLVMWWDIDLSKNNPTGEIVIEIPGRGPQIKLRPN